MALDRTWYDTLADDSGTGLDGTIWDKADVDALMDAVDTEIARLDGLIDDVEADLAALGAFRASAYANATQSIANATFVALNLQAELFDVGGMHDTVTNNTRITIPSGGDGYYLIIGNVFFASSATGHRAAQITKNGTGASQQVIVGNSGANNMVVQVSCILALVATDYIELTGFQASGGALNTGSAGATGTNMLTVTRLA